MPPHLGHKYLIDFARGCVDQLTVLVGTLQAEPIPGELRYSWMRELFPDLNVLHLTDENPQQPEDHPDFWNIWRESIRRLIPGRLDYVFASEEYGWKLAEVLGAKFIPVNNTRDLVPISGTAIRNDPLGNWEYLPECVRPYFVKRVCIFGPESCGKSTMAGNLAQQFNTIYVAEYARTWLEAHKIERCRPEDTPWIARGQAASEDALARQANRIMFCDTDLLTTVIWSKKLFGQCPEWIEKQALERNYDLYLLMNVDVPWVADSVRYFPSERRGFLERCRSMLKKTGRPYVVISGSWQERLSQARRAVAKLLEPSPGERTDNRACA